MHFTSETTSNGVSERLFTLDGVLGVLWAPADATGSRPVVPLGHGGGQHKKVPGLRSGSGACHWAAADARITAAVFGLASCETLAETVALVTVPVEFLLQWDDELVPRASHC
ncbi:MAG: hypothetical protein ACRDS0_10510 [Pseudonocardiaceae bacterium]